VNIGNLLIILALASISVSALAFLLVGRGRETLFGLAQTAYNYFTVLIILACGLLYYYFFSGDYSYRYVYEYSSLDLPFFYKLSSFWAGQQGTYLLWVFLLAVLGYFVIRRGGPYTGYAMFFYGLIIFFFMLLMTALSPFEQLPVAMSDGAGLNPLLKDPWMVIHPPIIFIGYAAVAIPCVIALAALLRQDYSSWLKVTFAPAALAAMMLAAGNIMGGFWAYKTLGWGGYWAWDPVENSSFIPWMTSLALIHGLLIERPTGALRKTNLFLAIFTFILVVYGTFLTRSGVLSDFSVHSFVDLGVNRYLVAFLVTFVILGFGIFAWRAYRIKGPTVGVKISSQEFALLLAVWILLLIGIMVLAGTSWPLLTTLLGNPGTVDIAVYSRVTFPLALIICFVLGFSPFMLWRGGETGSLIKKIIPSAVAAIAGIAVAWWAGVHNMEYLLFVAVSVFAIVSNLVALKKYLPNRFHRAGPQISHFGFALMMIGILGSSAYSTSEKLSVNLGETSKAMGLDFTYKGMASGITTPDNELILDIDDGSGVTEARPRLFWAERMGGMMKKPYIKRYFLYDIYVAPEQIQDLHTNNGLELSRGESAEIGGYRVTFTGFDQGDHQSGMGMKFGAKLDVVDSAGNSRTIIPALDFTQGDQLVNVDVPLDAEGTAHMVRLEHIYADEGRVQLSISGLAEAGPSERLICEVTRKPTMNMLWGGAILITLGGLLSFYNRYSLAGKPSKPAE